MSCVFQVTCIWIFSERLLLYQQIVLVLSKLTYVVIYFFSFTIMIFFFDLTSFYLLLLLTIFNLFFDWLFCVCVLTFGFYLELYVFF